MARSSKKQIEANKRNAMRSTGPRTEAGKARSRGNGLTHGLAAEVLVPEADRASYKAELARWTREAGPDNVVEHHLIRRAAIGSVQLDRIDTARESARESAAREAVRHWERRQQARARRKAQDLDRDPSNILLDLEATAFGCDWLIRQWQSLAAPLHLGKAWDQRTVAKAQRLLGLPEGIPGPGAIPEVRLLWILAAATAPQTITALPRSAAEAALPTDPASARLALLDFIANQTDRLLALRDESWEAVEGPERSAVIALALAADTSKEGQLRHRYAVAADRSCSAAIRLYLNLRDRRRRELLEIAKEARQCDTPRAPVGGGWWREPDSAPAPPGFSRIDAEPLGSDEPPPASPPPPLPPRPASDGAPKRSEPISTPSSTTTNSHNPNQFSQLRNTPPRLSPGAPQRTEPLRAPNQPALPPEDRRPPWPKSADDRPGSPSPQPGRR